MLFEQPCKRTGQRLYPDNVLATWVRHLAEDSQRQWMLQELDWQIRVGGVDLVVLKVLIDGRLRVFLEPVVLNLRKFLRQAHLRELITQSDNQQDVRKVLQKLIRPGELIPPVSRVFRLVQTVNDNGDALARALTRRIYGLNQPVEALRRPARNLEGRHEIVKPLACMKTLAQQ